MADRLPPLIDWSDHPAVILARKKDKRRTRFYVGLAVIGAGFLGSIAASDGLDSIDTLYFAVAGVLVFFAAAAAGSLAGFEKAHPGLKVYVDGLALPWRSRKAAKWEEENFLPFATISEIRVMPPTDKPSILVVRRDNEKPREFMIEPEWIPDVGALVSAIRGKVPVTESRDES